jgi:hypothetical protein
MCTALNNLLKNLPSHVVVKTDVKTAVTEPPVGNDFNAASPADAFAVSAFLQKNLKEAWDSRLISRRVNVALTGSQLYGGREKGDIDILLYPHDSQNSRDFTEQDKDSIVSYLQTKAISFTLICKNHNEYMNRDLYIFITPKKRFRIDLFFVSA